MSYELKRLERRVEALERRQNEWYARLDRAIALAEHVMKCAPVGSIAMTLLGYLLTGMDPVGIPGWPPKRKTVEVMCPECMVTIDLDHEENKHTTTFRATCPGCKHEFEVKL